MRDLFKLVLVLTICAIIAPNFATGLTNAQEVFIKFRKDASPSEIDSLTKELGLTKIKSHPEINVDVFKLSSEQSVSEVVKLCSNISFIEYIEPTQSVRAFPEEAAESPTTPEPEPAMAQQAETADFRAGELIVKFKTEIGEVSVNDVLTNAGIQIQKRYDEIGIYKCNTNRNVFEAIEECNQHPDVVYAEPNYVYKMSVDPNDSRYSSLYGMRQIDAPQAWDVQTGDKSIIVGVIDTGVDTDHSDLKANIWRNPGESGDGKENNKIDDDGNGFVDDYRGWDFNNDDNNPFDDNDHGTHVSGSIGAVGNNGKGVVGVCWNVSIMPLKFLAGNGSGTTDDAVGAIIYGANMGAKVLSNSWGGGGKSQALEDAIKFAHQKGVLFVAAAGNDFSNNDKAPTYPANYEVPNVVSVAANTSSDQLAGFSNYGKKTVELSAPGNNIFSTVARGQYASLSGTSMATPHVSGAAALVLSQYPNLSVNQLIIRLLGSVDRKSKYADKVSTGGRLNVFKALSTSPIIARTTRLGNTLDETGPYKVEAEVLDDSAVQGTTLTYQVTGQEAVTVAMTGSGQDKYKGEIPGQTLGSTVLYYVSATDDAGNMTKDSNFTFSIAESSSGGGCCGQPAVALDLENDTIGNSLSVALNVGFFMLPVFALRLFRRKKK